MATVYTQHTDMHSPLVISKADGRPMYLQIMEQVRAHIALGEWPPGSELPSIRQMAADLAVSVITVKRAYLELERDGVIQTQHGKGSTVAAQAPPLLHADLELDQRLRDALRLGRRLGLEPPAVAERLLEVASTEARGLWEASAVDEENRQ